MAGEAMKKAGLRPQYFFTSYLKRAIHTLQIAAEAMELDYIPVLKDWHLNERHYGALQGLNKAETAKKYGEEQVHIWRRSFDVLPPLLTPTDPRFPGNDPMYAALTADELPLSESLQDTIARVRCCWQEPSVSGCSPAAAAIRSRQDRRRKARRGMNSYLSTTAISET